MQSDYLILPDDPEYSETLATVLPPDWQNERGRWNGDYGFVVDSQTGMLRVENSIGIREYVQGGEYDKRLDCIDEVD